MIGTIIFLVLAAGLLCWTRENATCVLKWFFYILFFPVLVPLFLFCLVDSAVKSFRERAKD